MKKAYIAPELTVRTTVAATPIAALIPTKSEIELVDDSDEE